MAEPPNRDRRGGPKMSCRTGSTCNRAREDETLRSKSEPDNQLRSDTIAVNLVSKPRRGGRWRSASFPGRHLSQANATTCVQPRDAGAGPQDARRARMYLAVCMHASGGATESRYFMLCKTPSVLCDEPVSNKLLPDLTCRWINAAQCLAHRNRWACCLPCSSHMAILAHMSSSSSVSSSRRS